MGGASVCPSQARAVGTRGQRPSRSIPHPLSRRAVGRGSFWSPSVFPASTMPDGLMCVTKGKKVFSPTPVPPQRKGVKRGDWKPTQVALKVVALARNVCVSVCVFSSEEFLHGSLKHCLLEQLTL